MKKIKRRNAEQDRNTTNRTNGLEGHVSKYDPDDDMITYEQIEAIKKMVPQLDFKDAESLF